MDAKFWYGIGLAALVILAGVAVAFAQTFKNVRSIPDEGAFYNAVVEQTDEGIDFRLAPGLTVDGFGLVAGGASFDIVAPLGKTIVAVFYGQDGTFEAVAPDQVWGETEIALDGRAWTSGVYPVPWGGVIFPLEEPVTQLHVAFVVMLRANAVGASIEVNEVHIRVRFNSGQEM